MVDWDAHYAAEGLPSGVVKLLPQSQVGCWVSCADSYIILGKLKHDLSRTNSVWGSWSRGSLSVTSLADALLNKLLVTDRCAQQDKPSFLDPGDATQQGVIIITGER